MGRRRKTAPERPTAGALPPHSPQSPSPRATAQPGPVDPQRPGVGSLSRLLRPLFLFGFPVACVILTVCLWMITAEAQNNKNLLFASNSNSLLAAQQLDSLFELEWNRITNVAEHSTADRIALETWVRYDEKYVWEHEDQPSSDFQQANVHRRIGMCRFQLEDLAEAKQHLDLAVALFSKLAADQPSVNSYRSELADTYARMAWTLVRVEDAAGLEEIWRQFAQLTQNAPDPEDLLFNVQCMESCLNMAQIAERQGERTRARTQLEQAANILKHLIQVRPDEAEYRTRLDQVTLKLKHEELDAG